MDHPVYRIGNAAIVLREIVQRNINSPGAFVADNVEFLAYLGDNEGDALSGIAPGGSGGGDAENNAGKTLNNESEENDGRKGGFAFVLAIGVPIAVVALASLFSARNDRKKAFNRIFEQPIEEKVLSIENGDDPPGSFHEGMHHYMRDGTRYYSANCDQCREYNCVVLLDDNSFISPVKMEFVPENEAFDRSEQGKILPRPDVGLGLSQQHMGINVHKCKSATCNHCAPNSPYPTFVSTGVAAREANNDSSTSSSSPISTINSSTARSSVQSATFGSLFTDLATPTCVTIEKVADA